MQPGDQESLTSDDTIRKAKNGRTPLKQHPMPRPVATPPSTPLRKRRKRIGGKRTVRSCTSCRASHVRCVADRYGVPCERCAKKSWLDCTLIQEPQEQPAAKSIPVRKVDIVDLTSSQVDSLKRIASETLDLVAEGEKPELSSETSNTSTSEPVIESPGQES